MPRSYPDGLQELLEQDWCESHSTLALYVRPNENSGTTASLIPYYFATSAITVNGLTYQARLAKEAGSALLRQSLGVSVDRAQTSIEDADGAIRAEFAQWGSAMQGAEVELGRAWRNLDTGQWFDKVLMRGIVGQPSYNGRTINLSITSEHYAGGSVGGGRVVTLACPWKFGGRECGYSGAETTCNKLYDDAGGCSGRSNQHRHGGFIQLQGINAVNGASGLAAASVPTRNASIYDSLNAAVAAASTNPITLQISATLTVTNDVTVPATMQLQFIDGGEICGSGYTVTIAGEIVAPKRKIFCSGTVIKFMKDFYQPSRTIDIYPEWWGALPNSGTSCSTEMQAAVDSLTARGTGIIHFDGLYTLSATLDIIASNSDNNKAFFGMVLRGNAANGDGTYVSVSGLEWKGPSTDPVIRLHSRGTKIENLPIYAASGYFTPTAVDMDNPTGLAGTRNFLSHVTVQAAQSIKNTAISLTASSTTATVPAISGTWTNSGSTLTGSGGAALTEVFSGESILVAGVTRTVSYVTNNNLINLTSSAPTVSGGTITHAETFSASDVGQWIVIEEGGNASNTLPMVAQITAYTSSTQVTLDTASLRTAKGRATFGPIGSAVRIGATAASNQENHQIADCYFSSALIGVFIPSTTGQAKAVKIDRNLFSFNAYSILQNTGSFHANDNGFTGSYISNIGLVSSTDILKIDGVDSENSARLLRTYGGGSAFWGISLKDVRWSSNYLDSNGRAVWSTNGGGLQLYNCQFGDGSEVSRFRVYVTNAVQTGFSAIGCTFPNITPFEISTSVPVQMTALNNYGISSGTYPAIPNNITSAAGMLEMNGDSNVRRTYIGSPSWDTSYTAFQNATLSQSAANAAVAQSPAGSTILNAASGQSLFLKIANATYGTLTSSSLSVAVPTIQSGTPQTLTGAGAVNLTTYSTLLVTTGANALTLAAGSEGQFKFIRMKTDGGDGTLTVTNLQGGTTITFDDAGDFVYLLYQDAKWHILQNSGCTVA